jgi:tripartite-type tricarboxylate transporter receptor subunit TctC
MTRARFVVSIAFLLAMTALAGAQNYPNHLIKLMHGFPPGGNVDVLARVVADEMSKGLGQPIVIEAKPGVVGSLAAETVVRSPADGYTLLFLPSAHAVTAAIYKSIKYNAVDDFSWISTVSFYPFVLCVPKDSQFQTVADLLQYARANPGRLTYGSTGAGSIHHMTVELLAHTTKTKYVNVPYRGEAQILTGMLSGDVNFGMATVTVAAPHIESGAVRALAVTSKNRWKDLPNVPTLEEAGVPNYEVISWSGFAAPPGTPQAVIDRIHAEIQRAIKVPGVKEKLASLGGDVRGTTPAEMRELVARQVALWAKLAKEANIPAQ